MRHYLLAAAACGLFLAAAPGAHARLSVATGPPPPQPSIQFADAMNAGDTDGAARLLAPSATFTDDSLPPFFFHSFVDWNKARINRQGAGCHIDLQSFVAAGGGGRTDGDVSSFSVQPATVTYMRHGKRVTEKGFIKLKMLGTSGHPKITSFLFTKTDFQGNWDDSPGSHLQAK